MVRASPSRSWGPSAPSCPPASTTRWTARCPRAMPSGWRRKQDNGTSTSSGPRMPASPVSPRSGEQDRPRLHVVYSSHLDYGWIAHPHQLLSVASRILAGVIELAEADPAACYIWEDAFFLQAALKAFPERAASV